MKHDTPREVTRPDETTIRIMWSDGHESVYLNHSLRVNCGCASCIDEWSGQRKITPESIPQDIHPLQISPVGRYAMKIDWSDGHNTGLYPFEDLRKMCPCPVCHPAGRT